MTDERISRRGMVASSVVGAAVGASWLTGMSVLALGRAPQILVVGSGTWHVTLIEHQSRRVLIVGGDFDSFPEDGVRRTLGALRPRLDLLAGTLAHLEMAPDTMWRWRSVDIQLALDLVTPVGNPLHNAAIGNGIRLDVGALELAFTPLISGGWKSDEPRTSWIAHATHGNQVVALAPSLDDIGRHGDPRTAVAISPFGTPEFIRRKLPQTAIVTNAATVGSDQITYAESGSNAAATLLVRTFPNDIATLKFDGDAIRLPDWTDRVHIGRPDRQDYSSL